VTSASILRLCDDVGSSAEFGFVAASGAGSGAPSAIKGVSSSLLPLVEELAFVRLFPVVMNRRGLQSRQFEAGTGPGNLTGFSWDVEACVARWEIAPNAFRQAMLMSRGAGISEPGLRGGSGYTTDPAEQLTLRRLT
jgi:hypothetical protein